MKGIWGTPGLGTRSLLTRPHITMNYLPGGDSDNEERPISSNLAAVSESTESLVKEACTKRLPNSARLQTRNAFPLPQVVATRTPQLDSFIKLEISQPVKTSDKEWARIQTFILDALATLHPCWRQIPRERRLPTIRH